MLPEERLKALDEAGSRLHEFFVCWEGILGVDGLCEWAFCLDRSDGSWDL